MKIKGYISVFALMVLLLLFSLISVILIGVDMENNLNKNQVDYYQNCLISESLSNKLQFEEKYKNELEDIFKEMGRYKYLYDIELKEIKDVRKITVEINKKDGNYILTYPIGYKNTRTNSTMVYTEKENSILEEQEKLHIDKIEDKYTYKIDDYMEEISGNIIALNNEGINYFLEEEEYLKIIEKLEKEKDEDEEELDIVEIFKEYGKIIEKDKLYYFNMDSIEIVGENNIDISGIFINNGMILGNNIEIYGVLVNRGGNSEKLNVKGKVIEDKIFKGEVIFEEKILLNILETLKVEKKIELKEYFIQ